MDEVIDLTDEDFVEEWTFKDAVIALMDEYFMEDCLDMLNHNYDYRCGTIFRIARSLSENTYNPPLWNHVDTYQKVMRELQLKYSYQW